MAQARKSKVLRIAIIQDRKIKQERLIKAGEPVLIGVDPKKNTFVIPGNGVTGSSFVLFEPNGSGYALNFSEKFGTKSKVSTGGLAAKLHDLMNDNSVTRKGDRFQLQLTPQDRGKLDLGGVFVLFQFVPPPPIKAVKSIKAMDFRPRLIEDDDPIFFGFLAIWSALALVLTIWVWNSEIPVYTMEEIPDRFVQLQVKPPPKEIPPPEPLESDEIDPNKTVEKSSETAGKAAPPKEKSEPKSKGGKAKSIEDTKKGLESSSKFLAKMLVTTGDSSNGSMVADMWSDEDKGIGDIDAVLKEKSGGITTDANDPGLRGGKGGTGEAASIGDLGKVGAGGSAEVGGGPEVKVTGSVSLGSGTVDEDLGDAGKVKKVVRRYSGQMKYCYEQQLKKNRNLAGRVELGWSIYEGAVESVYVVTNTTGDKVLAKCMTGKLKRWKFDKGSDGDVSWPFVFRPSN